MPALPPPYISDRDRDQLKLLEIFHYVMVGLALGSMAFLFAHYSIMSIAMSQPFPKQNGQPPFDPKVFFQAFRWFYVFMGAWGLASLVINLISGLCIRSRKHRFFSMLVAGINCINVPFGTALGICTLIVLLRSSMPAIYHESR